MSRDKSGPYLGGTTEEFREAVKKVGRFKDFSIQLLCACCAVVDELSCESDVEMLRSLLKMGANPQYYIELCQVRAERVQELALPGGYEGDIKPQITRAINAVLKVCKINGFMHMKADYFG